jgi:predicted dehydrogenase
MTGSATNVQRDWGLCRWRVDLHRTMKRREFLTTTVAAAASLAASTPVFAQKKRWRVGVIGHTGRGDYGHGLHTMWLGVPETEIVGAADADAKGLEAARKKLNGARGFADYRQMLAETKPDIVAVCPRHLDQHSEMILAAVDAGVRGIYVEKPFCRTPAEADAIVSACAKSKVKLSVAHRNRWHPALVAAKKAIDEGAIGRVIELRGRGKEDPRGGALDLWVLGSHIANLIHYFGGKPRSCSAVMLKGNELVTRADVQPGAEAVGPIAGDRVHARYEMENGVTAYFDSIKSAGVAAAGFGLQVIGNKGIIDFRIDVQPLAHFVPGNPFQPTNEPRAWVPISSAGIGKPEPIENLKTQVANHILPARDLLAAIEQDRPTLCSAEDGRVTVEMITAVFASHVRGGARVALPLESREHPLAGWA